MSYSCVDQSDRLIALLTKAGYTVHHGDGYSTGPVVTELIDRSFSHDYDEKIDGFWFCWGAPGTDIETFETRDDELGAWTDAMEHWFANAKIALHAHADDPVANVVVYMDGGMVTGSTSDKPVSVLIVDYDVDEAGEDAELFLVLQEPLMPPAPADIGEITTVVDAAEVQTILELYELGSSKIER